MSKKFRNLYEQIYQWDNLLLAYAEARRGKTYSSSYLRFKEYALANLRNLQQRLIEESWKPDPQLQFDIIDPKKRTIACQSFRDRVLHHALIQVVGPILDAAMMPQVFACRVGLGTHRCVTRMQQLMRQNPNAWVLHVDFSKFFPTIPQEAVASTPRQEVDLPAHATADRASVISAAAWIANRCADQPVLLQLLGRKTRSFHCSERHRQFCALHG